MRNFSMFWRIVRRLITANYGRLFVILLALGAGAAITAALLNLQIDAKKRLATEFRALGANVIIAAKAGTASASGDAASSGPNTIDETILGRLPQQNDGKAIPTVGFLYLIGSVAKQGTDKFEPAVLAGTTGQGLAEVRPGVRTKFSAVEEKDASACEIGAKAAEQFHVQAGDILVLRALGREATCTVFAMVATGG